MKNFSNRLNRVEDALIPKSRMALCFGRRNCFELDLQRQKQEYESFYGDYRNVTFCAITDYGSDENEPFEDFLKRNRLRSGYENPLGWWPKILDEEIE
jgi:hypothetical protein